MSAPAELAYVVLAHRSPDQVVRLVRRLETPHASFFVHVDRSADDRVYEAVRSGLADLSSVSFVRRRSCTWGGFGIVRAILEALKAVRADGRRFDFVVLLSGQDYPIATTTAIHQRLGEHRGHSFVNNFTVPTPNWANGGLERLTGWHWHGRVLGRHVMFPDQRLLAKTWQRRFPGGFQPYGGSMYWALSDAALDYLHDFLARNRRFVRFFKHVNIPDESFFQTILLNSPLAPTVIDDDLHYADWSELQSHPKTLGHRDVGAALGSGKLFARKFDNPKVLDAIDARVHGDAR